MIWSGSQACKALKSFRSIDWLHSDWRAGLRITQMKMRASYKIGFEEKDVLCVWDVFVFRGGSFTTNQRVLVNNRSSQAQTFRSHWVCFLVQKWKFFAWQRCDATEPAGLDVKYPLSSLACTVNTVCIGCPKSGDVIPLSATDRAGVGAELQTTEIRYEDLRSWWFHVRVGVPDGQCAMRALVSKLAIRASVTTLTNTSFKDPGGLQLSAGSLSH